VNEDYEWYENALKVGLNAGFILVDIAAGAVCTSATGGNLAVGALCSATSNMATGFLKHELEKLCVDKMTDLEKEDKVAEKWNLKINKY
jgi:hypothetical protein